MPIKPVTAPAYLAMQRSLRGIRRPSGESFAAAIEAPTVSERTLLEMRQEIRRGHPTITTVQLSGEMLGTLLDERA